jgi:hypothetical protein
MKYLGLLVGVGLVLAIAGTAGAVTFVFDPNDLLDLYPQPYTETDVKVSQENARRLHETWASNWYNTFSDGLAAGHSQPTDYNTYVNWRNGLGANEGLGSFSLWLRGDVGARSWGEVLLSDPNKELTATAASGWNVEVVDNIWNTGEGYGQVAVWWTTDPALYLRPGGADIGNFSFSGDIYVDTNGDNYITGESLAQVGTPYRVWFADTTMNQGDDEVRALVFDDGGWGTLDPSADAFASATAGDSALEAVLTLSPVPEPATMTLIALGMGVAAVLRARRRGK